jgi:large subunit ribosomal protein L23
VNDSRLHNVLLGPHTTEKSVAAAQGKGRITFKVLCDATKPEIKKAVEKLFNVNVRTVNVINMEGKTRRFKQRPGKRSDWKKAVVSLVPGQDINFAEFKV